MCWIHSIGILQCAVEVVQCIFKAPDSVKMSPDWTCVRSPRKEASGLDRSTSQCCSTHCPPWFWRPVIMPGPILLTWPHGVDNVAEVLWSHIALRASSRVWRPQLRDLFFFSWPSLKTTGRNFYMGNKHTTVAEQWKKLRQEWGSLGRLWESCFIHTASFPPVKWHLS